MQCISCKGEWTPPPGITVTECPFCKKSIEPTKTPKTYDNAKDALFFIAQTYGAEALLTKNLFSDIAPTLSDERELIKMFREKGALDVLKGALKSTESEQNVAIKRAITKLPSYLQNSPEALSLLNDFTVALGWQVSPSIEWQRNVSDQGNAEAKEALAWTENNKPVQQLSAEECYEKGEAYYYGEGVPQDYKQAVEWYRKAAEQEHADAQYSLGYMYEYGQGVPQDYLYAAEWYRKSAEQDNSSAQYSLAILYMSGWGVPQDVEQSVRWFIKAAEQGNPDALEALARVR